MSQEGFASFIPDDLPGFNSLNGSGFFDQAGEWGDLSSDSAAEHDAFDSRTFKLVRTNSPRDVTAIQQQQEEIDVSFVDVSEDEEEEDELDISQFLVVKEEQEQKPRPSRRRSTGERPVRTERRKTTEGKKVRRHRSSEEGADTRQRTSRRTRSGEAHVPRDSRRRSSTTRRRPEHPSSRKGMDLGAKLDRLGNHNSDPAAVVPEAPRRRRPSQLRKSHSIPLPEDDAVSVGSRQSRQSAGCPRTCRRRRATLSHNLLARNLQQLAASGALEQQEPSMDISCKSNREEAWKSRRRRSAQVVNAISVPALAA